MPPCNTMYLLGRAALGRQASTCDSPNTSRRFALGANINNVCRVGENPTCSFPALQRCEGLYMVVRLRPCMIQAHPPSPRQRPHTSLPILVEGRPEGSIDCPRPRSLPHREPGFLRTPGDLDFLLRPVPKRLQITENEEGPERKRCHKWWELDRRMPIQT